MSKTGIIGAMDLEVDALKREMSVTRRLKKARMEFLEGRLCGADAVIVKCGIGKVNAALCVQILSDLFGVTHIINTGIAGALNPELKQGDIVISNTAVHHDMDVTCLGYAPGEVPSMDIKEFPADIRLVNLAEETCRKLFPDINIMTGRVVSGDQFIADRAAKGRLISTFGGDCCEMEGASVAHGAYLNDIPFVILRAMSDTAEPESLISYEEFESIAAERCAALAAALLPKI